ncbi:MAG: hypothetical protein AB1331_00755 [Bacillota bacterium]
MVPVLWAYLTRTGIRAARRWFRVWRLRIGQVNSTPWMNLAPPRATPHLDHALRALSVRVQASQGEDQAQAVIAHPDL